MPMIKKKHTIIQILLRKICALYLLPFALHPSPCLAQEAIPLTYQSTLLGIGKTNVYDSYLSPLLYKGVNIGLIYEQMKMTALWDGNVSAQHLFNLEVAETDNVSGTATDYAGSLEYGYGLHYRFQPVHKIRFFAGMQAGGLVGFIYNTRNGNNPATAKVNINLNASGMAAYRFQIRNQPVDLRYQLNIPLAGMLFSPEFGQSYYEIGMETGTPLMYFASFHNQLAMRNLFSVELPFASCTLRLAYMNWVYETQINDLDTHILSQSFYFGFSKQFYTVSGKKQTKNQYRSVFE
jgi:hypothetical protein